MQRQPRLALALTAIVLAGCSPDAPSPTPASSAPSASAAPQPTETPTPSPSSEPSPSPSPSPSAWESFPPPPEGESEEIRAIREGWEKHERLFDKYAKDSSLNELTELVQTTSGQRTADVVKSLGSMRDQGFIHVGDVTFRDVEIDEPNRNDDGETTSTVTVCKDFTHRKTIVEATGAEATLGDGRQQVPTVRARIMLSQLPNGQWVVSDATGDPETC